MLVSTQLATLHDAAPLMDGLELKIEHLPVEELVAYGRKARTHTRKMIQQLATMIDEFGFVVPVIVDQRGRVLAGNARVKAARLLALKTVPAVRLRHSRSCRNARSCWPTTKSGSEPPRVCRRLIGLSPTRR